MNGDDLRTLVQVVLAIAAGVIGLVVLIYLIVPIGRGIAWVIRSVFGFIFGVIGDLFRFIGAVLTGLFFIPLILANVLIGRWSAATHFGRSLQGECRTGLACVYRMLIGRPLKLVGMGNVVEGIEQRVPQAMAAAPGADKPSSKTGKFDGYQIVGSLPGGGSGGKLYVANPDAIKRAGFERAGQYGVSQVVIKSFSLGDGSSLPQIVRESRALEAAKKMGLVLDHEMTNERFYYVMRYVPGQSLSLVMQQLHAAAGNVGLGQQGLRAALQYGSDLLRTLDAYHRGGLWHKDVKPDNIIVDADHAHLVDFGLLTHLSSSMTLTTHGTEYFRDPEMVRMSLRGVKVHEVDGAKFDIFAAGAVLYAMIENSFPAHGALSQVTKPCPEALRWIIRRAMTEYDKRYTSTAQMLLDLETVRQAPDPFAVTPAMLPSMREGLGDQPAQPPIDPFVGQAAAAGAWAGRGNPMPPPIPGAFPGANAGPGRAAAAGLGAGVAGVGMPRIRVTNWWTGKHEVEHGLGQDAPTSAYPHAGPHQTPPPWPPKPEDIGRYAQEVAAGAMGSASEALRIAGEALKKSGVGIHVGKRGIGGPAHEQLSRARQRMEARRKRAQERMHRRRQMKGDFKTSPNRGVGLAVIAMVGLIVWISNSHRVGSTMRQRSLDWGSASGTVSPELTIAAGDLATARTNAAIASSQAAVVKQIEQQKAMLAKDMKHLRGTAAKDMRKRMAGLDAQLAQLHSTLPEAAYDMNDPGAEIMRTIENQVPQVEEGVSVEQSLKDAWEGADGQVIVVVDLPKPLSTERQQAIAAMLLKLAEEGVQLVGDFPHNPAAGEESKAQLDLVAGMLSARGIEPLGSEQARANVSKWLVNQKDLDGALWIGPDKSPLAEATAKDAGKKKVAESALAFTIVAPELKKLDEERRDHVTDIVKRIAVLLSGEAKD